MRRGRATSLAGRQRKNRGRRAGEERGAGIGHVGGSPRPAGAGRFPSHELPGIAGGGDAGGSSSGGRRAGARPAVRAEYQGS